jgi:hypothetical protein
MDKDSNITDAITLLNDHLDINQTSLELKDDKLKTYQLLRDKLADVINYLLNNDMERLMTAVYRIDVPEEKFKSAMNGENINLISENITDLILEREFQKVEFRKKYSN